MDIHTYSYFCELFNTLVYTWVLLHMFAYSYIGIFFYNIEQFAYLYKLLQFFSFIFIFLPVSKFLLHCLLTKDVSY